MNDSLHEWFYTEDGQQPMGPVSQAELLRLLEAGRLQRDSLVWRQGMENWQSLQQALALPEPESVSEPEAGPAPEPALVPEAAPAAFADMAPVAPTSAPGASTQPGPVEPVPKRLSGCMIAALAGAALLVSVALILGAIAAFALPASQDFDLRVKVFQTGIALQPYRAEIAKHFQAQGECLRNGQGGMPDPEAFAIPYVSRVLLGQDSESGECVISVTFADVGSSELDGSVLHWHGTGSDWRCRSEDIRHRLLPPDCR